MNLENLQRQWIFVVTVVSLGEDPLEYDNAVAAFTNKQDAEAFWQEAMDERSDDDGIKYYIEETWLHSRHTVPEMSE